MAETDRWTQSHRFVWIIALVLTYCFLTEIQTEPQLHGSPSHLMIFLLYYNRINTRPKLAWVWLSFIWNNIRWLEVPFEIQLNEAIRPTPCENCLLGWILNQIFPFEDLLLLVNRSFLNLESYDHFSTFSASDLL